MNVAQSRIIGKTIVQIPNGRIPRSQTRKMEEKEQELEDREDDFIVQLFHLNTQFVGDDNDTNRIDDDDVIFDDDPLTPTIRPTYSQSPPLLPQLSPHLLPPLPHQPPHRRSRSSSN